MPKQTKQKCFVIMPFSKTTEQHTKVYWNEHYSDFLKPLIESHPLTAFRSEPLRGDMLRQIITNLVTLPIVVADLTDSNPNVYWELGVRQSFKHCTITIAEHGTGLPFDIGIKGTLFYYPNDHIKMTEFTGQFDNAIKDCLDNPHSPDSHVLETISGRGTLFQILMKDESIRKLDAILSEIQDNLSVLERCKTVYPKNAIIRKEHKGAVISVITVRLRIAALDNLIVNRYIDAPNVLYQTAETHREHCVAINSRLDICDLSSLSAELPEIWILDFLKDARTTTNTFKKLITAQRKHIRLSL